MSLVKQFIKDSTIYSLKPILVQGLSIILIPLYTKYLTPSDYGNLSYILMFSSFFKCIISLGMNNSFWKFRTRTTGYDHNDITKVLLLSQLFLAFSLLSILTLLNIILIKNGFFYLILFALLIETVGIIYDTRLVLYRANFEAYKYLITTILFTFISLTLNIAFIKYLGLNFKGVLFSSFFANLLLSAITFKLFLSNIRIAQISSHLFKEMLKYGYPLMLGNLMLLILSLSDRFLIKNFGNDTMLGLYSFGSKFGNIFNVLIIGPFSLAWIPLRWKIYERQDGKEVFSIFNRFFLVFSPLLACSFCFILPLFIDLITVNKDYLEGLSIMSFALVSQVFFGLNYFNHMGFLFKDKTQMIMGITFISASINIILNIFLIKNYGFIGAGISAMIAYFVLFLITRIISQKIYPIKRNKGLELFQIIVLFILGFAFPIIRKLIDNLLLLSAIFLIIFFILLIMNFVLGFLSFEDYKLLKQTLYKPNPNKERNP